MPNTVPNQKIIHINREMPTKDFLQIKKENWYQANKDLTPYGLQLYLYLAGNANGYDLAMSQRVAEETAGIKRTTYHTYMNEMIRKGYLVPKGEGSNVYDFYEKPHIKEDQEGSSRGGQEKPQGNKGGLSLNGQVCSSEKIEIYNKRQEKNKIYSAGEKFVF